MSEKLTAFLATCDRYIKAPARRCLTQAMPMSPDFSMLVKMPGLLEAPRHAIIERLVAHGAKIVPHSEREIRGSTMHIQIGRALTIPSKSDAVWAMEDAGKYGLAYAAHLGAPEVKPETEEEA